MKRMTGLNPKEVSAWDLSARNFCPTGVVMTWDDFHFAFPEASLIDRDDSLMLLDRDKALDWYTQIGNLIEDIPVALAVTVNPWLALLGPVLGKAQQRLTQAAPDLQGFKSKLDTQFQLIRGGSSHMKSLGGPIGKKLIARPLILEVDCTTKEILK